MPINVRGIVFDVDGVLFDTEPLHIRAWLSTAVFFGFPLTEDDLVSWTGKPCNDLAAFLSQDKKGVPSKEALLVKKEELFREYLDASPFFNEGIKGLLDELSRDFVFAWATSSPRENIELMFNKADIMKYFYFGVCVEDVNNPKPDPESYLEAVSGLNLLPQDCIALDDSPTGIASAVSAGIYTLGIQGVFDKRELNMADRVFSSTPEALGWILSNFGKKY